jgi:hypothetical protein
VAVNERPVGPGLGSVGLRSRRWQFSTRAISRARRSSIWRNSRCIRARPQSALRRSSRRNGPVLDRLGGGSCYIRSASYDMPNPLRLLTLIKTSERFRSVSSTVSSTALFIFHLHRIKRRPSAGGSCGRLPPVAVLGPPSRSGAIEDAPERDWPDVRPCACVAISARKPRSPDFQQMQIVPATTCGMSCRLFDAFNLSPNSTPQGKQSKAKEERAQQPH